MYVIKLFESFKDKEHFNDFIDAFSEEFPLIKHEILFYDNRVEFSILYLNKKTLNSKLINFINFWIQILDDNEFKFESGSLYFSNKKRDFKFWSKMKWYLFQIEGEDKFYKISIIFS
jgi:hypothetical protein